MNWTWNIRSNDGAMNGLEFARCTTAGGFSRALIHAAPSKAKIEIIDGDDQLVARADLERSGEYSPMTLVEIDGRALRRSEVWPTEDFYGLPVLLAGGEVGILQSGSTPRITAGGGGQWSSPITPAVLMTGRPRASTCAADLARAEHPVR